MCHHTGSAHAIIFLQRTHATLATFNAQKTMPQAKHTHTQTDTHTHAHRQSQQTHLHNVKNIRMVWLHPIHKESVIFHFALMHIYVSKHSASRIHITKHTYTHPPNSVCTATAIDNREVNRFGVSPFAEMLCNLQQRAHPILS